ncbi:hypothetical protein ACFL59_04920 [Planctomycetota bacterium]
MHVSSYRGYRMHPHAEAKAEERHIGIEAVLAALVFGSRYPERKGRTLAIVDEAALDLASGFGVDLSKFLRLTLVLNDAERLVITCFVRRAAVASSIAA